MTPYLNLLLKGNTSAQEIKFRIEFIASLQSVYKL